MKIASKLFLGFFIIAIFSGINGYVGYSSISNILQLSDDHEMQRDLIDKTIGTIVLLTTISVLLALALGFLISTSIAIPARKLGDAANRIARGDYDLKIHPTSNDEIGQLSSQFDMMRVRIKKMTENLSSIVKDRTKDLEKANAELQIKELKYRNLYEGSPDLYRTINTDGIILDCNKSYASSLGYTKEEVIGKSIFDHVPSSEISAMESSFDTWKNTGRVLNRNAIFQRKDGSKFPVIVSARSLYDDDGKLIGSNTVIRDMSELHDAEKKIKYEKLKRFSVIGELSSRLAHDFRNPLSVIKNTLELLRLELKDNLNEKTMKQMQRLERAVIRMTHQVEEVLDFVKEKPLKLAETSVVFILKSTLERLNVPPKIAINLPHNDISIFCDSEKLEIVFVNLILNAMQAMGHDGKVDIRITDLNDDIVIEIQDWGPGIPNELMPKLFDPLFTTRQIGTGLGLASCKTIVEKHEGEITVSTILGKGTTFKIMLPKKPSKKAFKFDEILNVEQEKSE